MPNKNPKGWIEDVFDCVKMIEQDVFSLDNIYIYEAHLASLHPNNNNIKAKIRQQLQNLRNNGKLEFINYNGTYKKTFK